MLGKMNACLEGIYTDEGKASGFSYLGLSHDDKETISSKSILQYRDTLIFLIFF